MRDLRDRLADIWAAAADILAFVAGLDEAAFATLPQTDRRTYRAIKNALVEIGEAIKQLTPEVLSVHRGIDWRGFAGLRDIVGRAWHAQLQAEVRSRLSLGYRWPGGAVAGNPA